MSTVIELYWQGRYIKNAKITPGTVNALTGVITKGTTVDLAVAPRYVDSVRFDQTVQQENIKAANATMANYVNLYDDFDVEVVEIKHNDGQGKTLNAWVGVDLFLVEVITSPDGGTTQALIQAWCSRSGLTDEFVEGKASLVLRGKPCGLPIVYIVAATGTPTPIY